MAFLQHLKKKKNYLSRTHGVIEFILLNFLMHLIKKIHITTTNRFWSDYMVLFQLCMSARLSLPQLLFLSFCRFLHCMFLNLMDLKTIKERLNLITSLTPSYFTKVQNVFVLHMPGVLVSLQVSYRLPSRNHEGKLHDLDIKLRCNSRTSSSHLHIGTRDKVKPISKYFDRI